MAEFDECRDVLARIHLFLDGELSEEEGDGIRRHLLGCEHCLDHADTEQAIRSLLKRCCTKDRAPDTLRVRVMAAVRESFGGGVEVRSVEIHQTIERRTRSIG